MPSPPSSTPAASRATRVLLAFGAAPLLFVVVLLIAGALRPGYDPLHHWGSELSLGDGGWVQTANFVAVGLLTTAFAVGVRRELDGGRGSVAIPLFTGLFGIGLVVQGIFPVDPYVGYPPGSEGTTEPTLNGVVHDLNMFPTFGALTAAMFAAAYRSMGRPGEWAWTMLTLAAGVLTPATMMIAAHQFDSAAQTGAFHGLWQRVSLAIGFGWYALLGARLLRANSLSRKPPSTAALNDG
ncbi:uncharacterized protein DUF998 [Murinocardiopsis flavida]|uniref:Uncharacterized protein DUF998 n=1 Tax=Murinocardiopsis flavida TaxID=645275 RepID=A0A2P8DEI0_9ACTN|nr:DUF998 domain-containing protein [Murinocardiopsis flavida]PSK95636.1 uncharacterized protein DUF998 [Murinocardiopsis flavida]